MLNPDTRFETLTSLLEWRFRQTPGDDALVFEGKVFSFAWLWENTIKYASVLRKAGVREGDRILLLTPNSPSFFLAFYGGLMCRAIAVPVFPGANTARCTRIARLSGASHLVLNADVPKEREVEFLAWAMANEIVLHRVNENVDDQGAEADFSPASRDDIAFIQFTSGSMDFPKGVPLSHEMLLTNIRQMVSAMDITDGDVFVSWLPVYHDMGLILMTMVPLYVGAKLVLLPVGMNRIHSWLKAIEQYQGTFIAAPDTAYRLCVKGTRHPDNYDLSSLRVILNASEPIHLSTYRMFEESFGLGHVMVSGYGLAEATVAVTMHPPGRPPVTDKHGNVASGVPVQGVEIRIDPDRLIEADEQVGEILVRSPALMSGYDHQLPANSPFDTSGFLRTGDAGYLDEMGNLFVLSRLKNIIIHAGHTLYPDDVEQVVRIFAGVRSAAAVGIPNPRSGGENLCVFAELGKHRSPGAEACHNLVIEMVREIHDSFGVRPAKVFLLKPKAIPRTPNGKVRYHELKRQFMNTGGNFRDHILYPDL